MCVRVRPRLLLMWNHKRLVLARLFGWMVCCLGWKRWKGGGTDNHRPTATDRTTARTTATDRLPPTSSRGRPNATITNLTQERFELPTF